MAIQSHFNNFDKKIYLTSHSGGYKKAKDKDNSIFDEIKSAFINAGYPVIDTFMQGSFAVNTAINSLDGDFDIDRAIVISATTAPEDPLEPKKIILEVLQKRNFKDPRIKTPCVTADYQSINLHIDYTVYKKDSSLFTDDSYYLAVGKNGSSVENKEWSESDQKGLIHWIGSSDDYFLGPIAKRKQLKRLIRYMKRWRDVNFSKEVGNKIFSIALTVMVKEQYKPDAFSIDVENDLKALQSTIHNILEAKYISAPMGTSNYRVSVKLPTKPYRDIFQHKVKGVRSNGSDLNIGTQFKNKLTSLNAELKKAINEVDETEQCVILNKIFGDDFIIPNNNNNNNNKSTGGISLLSTAGASGTSQGA